jgi:pantoate--beta-alanine ligase
MQIYKSPTKLQKEITKLKKQGKAIGFVPTMGALHQGHLSLIAKSKQKCDITIASIFVNPTQFGKNEDLDKYPKPIKKDQELLSNLDTNILFLPNKNVIYPGSKETATEILVPKLSNILCGNKRTNHFSGVVTIVCKLLNITQPDYAFFGEKDFQQFVIIKKMAQDLFIPTKIISVKTTREKSGLAMSSRNTYLSKENRKEAAKIYKALSLGVILFKNGETSTSKIINEIQNHLNKTKIETEYLKMVDPNTLNTKQKAKKKDRIIFAGKLGTTRLIDNIELN